MIWIYRDGRDVVSSCYRHGGMSGASKQVGDQRPQWACDNVYDGSLKWAQTMVRWHNIYIKYKHVIDILEIRFEEMLKYPAMISEDIGNFLDINPDIVYNNIRQKVSNRASNMGNYKKVIPNWEKEFAPAAISMLEILKYI
jgi:hypothetical protein